MTGSGSESGHSRAMVTSAKRQSLLKLVALFIRAKEGTIMAFLRQETLLSSSNSAPIATSMQWINDLLLGPLAVSLCVLAVAFFGAMMLTGRLRLYRGLRVVIGCFVLLGAPVIASGFMWASDDRNEPLPPLPVESRESPRGDLQPADYDPYSGA